MSYFKIKIPKKLRINEKKMLEKYVEKFLTKKNYTVNN